MEKSGKILKNPTNSKIAKNSSFFLKHPKNSQNKCLYKSKMSKMVNVENFLRRLRRQMSNVFLRRLRRHMFNLFSSNKQRKGWGSLRSGNFMCFHTCFMCFPKKRYALGFCITEKRKGFSVTQSPAKIPGQF